MWHKAKLKRTSILSISVLAFMIAAGSFTDAIWAERDGHIAVDQHRKTSALYFDSAFGTPSPTVTATPIATPQPGVVHLSSAAFEVNEGYTARIGVFGSPTQQGSSALVASFDGTAIGGTTCIAGVDYVTINQGVSFFGFFNLDLYREVLIATCPDAFGESDETIKITLSPGSASVRRMVRRGDSEECGSWKTSWTCRRHC
jgi:hypothetical protein